MNLIKRFATVLAAVAAVVTSTAVMAQCQEGGLCMYQNFNYVRPAWIVYPGADSSTVPALYGYQNDSISSVYNNSFQGMCLYEHYNYGGLQFKVEGRSGVAAMPWWFNDKGSSLRRC